MSINKIIYYAANDTMGDTAGQACAQFRAWAKNELMIRFPDFEINVLNAGASTQVEVYATSEHYACEQERIEGFARELWDRCPWEGKYFE